MRLFALCAVAVVSLITVAPAEGRQTIPASYRVAAASAAAPVAASTADVPAEAPESPAPAPMPPREWFGHGTAWHDWSRLTGDWGSARTSLESKGVTFAMNYTGDASALGTGRTGANAVGRALADVSVELDFERLWGQKGGKAFVQYERKSGGIGGRCLGEGQGFSNIDSDDFSALYEVWVEQQIGSKVRVKAGIIDANSEFAFVENGGEFINSSMGFTPTIALLPTYPDPHAGVVVQVQPSEHVYIGGGVFNAGPAVGVGNFDARFSIGEAGVRWTGLGGGRLSVGYWYAGGQAAAEDGARVSLSTGGAYLVFDQSLWRRDERAVDMFAQFGAADDDFSRVSRHASVGVSATGLVPGRVQDVVGVAVTGVSFGQPGTCAESGAGRFDEINIGAFYKVPVTPWFALKPDLQYVIHPLGAATRPALVGTVRVEIGF